MAARLGLALLVLAAGAGAAEAAAAGAPWMPKTLDCTPWSWALCKPAGKGVYKVDVDETGGGGMQAPFHYINGYFSLDMKLPAGNSGGVNFAWYLMDTISPSNKDPLHSEIDIEFYGNTTGDTVLLALNVFANGKQNLAQFRLPFDPSAAFHSYAIKWSPTQIVWLVDGAPLRILNKTPGSAWPMHPMKPMASVWATPWTALKADYTNGPIGAYYGKFKALGCKTAEKAVQKAPVECAGPWNAPLTPAQLAAYNKLHKASLVVDYGWDKA